MKNIFTEIKNSLNNVYLIDKVLMIYMLILLAYTAVHLLFNETMQESTTVDIIIRTSASAIFGYFISNNFIKPKSDTKGQNTSVPNINDENTINQTHPQHWADTNNADSYKNAVTDSRACCNKLQIMVVSGIGLISLILLLISRNSTRLTPEFSATVSQLRDFLSACIGFLVSCGKAK